ncbi:MAG: nucleoside hydrolase [Halothermotrichaceae bacterium]
MNFSKISIQERFKKLKHPGKKVRMVLDTDTYNEVDDQFALAYALKSPEAMQVEAIYAAPFHNNRSSGPEDGMEKSYQEIINILNMIDVSTEGFVYKGSRGYLEDGKTPQESKAARNLIKKAKTATEDEPLYVVSIGAITNVASAILMEPDIISKIVVVWLGGHAHYWADNNAFNLFQDIYASRLIFDCGVPLVHIPCKGVSSHLITTAPELEYYLKGKSKIGTYLTDMVSNETKNFYAGSRIIWDISTIAWLINPDWIPSNIVLSPIINDDYTWSYDDSRHFIRCATYANRDKIFADLFNKLT